VGVFVNASVEEIERVAEQVGLDYLQLHGDESPELIERLAPRRVLRAFRMGAAGWQPVVAYLTACRSKGFEPAALLIDAHAFGLYGGTGQTADWNVVRARPNELGDVPIILAGGLTPVNVSAAAAVAVPWGVDTASGVETSPGVKDPVKVREFVSQARAALSKLEFRR
jgi:phosphoribosylanthranilate isomerase